MTRRRNGAALNLDSCNPYQVDFLISIRTISYGLLAPEFLYNFLFTVIDISPLPLFGKVCFDLNRVNP